jgi:hypothetical protein
MADDGMRAQNLIDAARARTGLDDFGTDPWREGFDVLLASLAQDAALNPIGEAVIGDALTKLLTNRLEIEDWFNRYPEIGEQVISLPLFGLGLPRTGSTALGTMLSLDPARRSLRTWEAAQPCPPPQTATELSDPRIAVAEASIVATLAMFPDYAGMLPASATGPTECLLPMASAFRAHYFEALARVPGYTRWLLQSDMEPAYRYHRRVLQLLQWRCPPTSWSLRTPAHMHGIVELDRVYPGARFVMTHRDIASVIPSLAALLTALSGSLTTNPDPAALGSHCADFWETSLRRLLAFRDAGNEGRFFDIAFAEFQAAPIEVMRRLYAWLGEDLSREAESRMSSWWRTNAETRQPAKRHRPEDFGVTAQELDAKFAFYMRRFDIPAAITR